MSYFRSPIYLDTETLVPLANYHQIEVMVDIDVTQRDAGKRGLGAGAKASLPGVGSVQADGSRGSETETTQAKTVKDHPTFAFNRLVDTLTKEDALNTSLTEGVRRGDLVELEAEWEIAPATDAGNFLSKMIGVMMQNPGAMQSDDIPDDVVSSMLGGGAAEGPIILAGEPDNENMRVLVILEGGLLLPNVSIDDLETEKTVFARVESVIPEGKIYSLENFFMRGISRQLRRAFNPEDLMKDMNDGFGNSMTIDDLRLAGPLVVLRGIAVY